MRTPSAEATGASLAFVDEGEQLLRGFLDLRVLVLAGPGFGGDDSGAVDDEEVAVGEGVGLLRARVRGFVDAEVPFRVASQPLFVMKTSSLSALGFSADQSPRSLRSTLPARISSRAYSTASELSEMVMRSI